jgi:hypothetical protein
VYLLEAGEDGGDLPPLFKIDERVLPHHHEVLVALSASWLCEVSSYHAKGGYGELERRRTYSIKVRSDRMTPT